jgi:hypothetical protein
VENGVFIKFSVGGFDGGSIVAVANSNICNLRFELCLVWARASGAYLLFLHVQFCVIVGCCVLLGLSFLDMTTLHFSLISLVDLPLWLFFAMGSLMVMVVVDVSILVRCLLGLLIPV